MNHVDALIFCLGDIRHAPGGPKRSRLVYDRNNDPHWVEIEDGLPRLCAEVEDPFHANYSPFSPTKVKKGRAS